MDWSSIRGLTRSLEPRGLVLALSMMTFWLIVVNKASKGRMWSGLSRNPRAYTWPLGLGALAFPASIVYLQVPLQTIAGAWVMENLATANLLLLGIPSVALSGIVQETAKLAVTLAALRLAGTMAFQSERIRMGVLAGAGYGAIEAWILLSPALTFSGVGHSLLLLSIFERFVTIAFHLSSTGVLAHLWAKGATRRIVALLAVSTYHGAVNYSILLLQVGILNIALFYALLSAATMAIFAYAIAMMRRGTQCRPEPD